MNTKWGVDRHILETSLAPTECLARLQARIGKWPYFRVNPERPVNGRVSASGFSLTKAVNGRNSFQTEARGAFVTVDGRTQIRVSLGPSPLVLALGVAWLAFVGGAWLAALLRGGLGGGLLDVIPAFMLLIGVVIAGLGRWSARNEGAFLLRFLQTELEAHELL
jgi:hypothetical protein